MIDAWNIRRTGLNAGRQHHFIGVAQLIHRDPKAGFNHHARCRQLIAEIAQRFAELRFAGDLPGNIELTANLRRGLIERHLMSALRRL